MYRRTLLALALAMSIGCVRDNTVEVKAPANPDAPTPIIPATHLVEFRVTGTVGLTTITASDTQEGLSIIDTGLPWFQTFKITKDTFLYLDAVSNDFGIVHVQIYVDGALFREAYATGFAPKISVSGQFHVGS